MDKRGVSDIVAAVLIIFLTVGAGIFVYSFIMPYIKTETSVSQECYYAEIGILDGDYTYYNSTTNEIYVQVLRGNRETELSGMQIRLSGGGDSVIVEVREGPSTSVLRELGETTISLPGIEETRTYVIDLDVLGIIINDSNVVEIAPIVRLGNKESICNIRDETVLETN